MVSLCGMGFETNTRRSGKCFLCSLLPHPFSHEKEHKDNDQSHWLVGGKWRKAKSETVSIIVPQLTGHMRLCVL